MKDFLRPNKQKLIIFVILLLLVPYPYLIMPVASGVSPAINFLFWIFSYILGILISGSDLNVFLLIIMIIHFAVSFSLNYLIASLLYKYFKLKLSLLITVGLVITLSVFPIFTFVREHESKGHNLIDYYVTSIKEPLQRRKIEKLKQEGEVVKLIDIANENYIIVESKEYYVADVTFEGTKSGFKISTPICTQNRQWLKRNSCYRWKSEEEMRKRKDNQSGIRPGGGSCYSGLLEEVSCE